jgi:hypothetical protein
VPEEEEEIPVTTKCKSIQINKEAAEQQTAGVITNYRSAMVAQPVYEEVNFLLEQSLREVQTSTSHNMRCCWSPTQLQESEKLLPLLHLPPLRDDVN